MNQMRILIQFLFIALVRDAFLDIVMYRLEISQPVTMPGLIGRAVLSNRLIIHFQHLVEVFGIHFLDIFGQ